MKIVRYLFFFLCFGCFKIVLCRLFCGVDMWICGGFWIRIRRILVKRYRIVVYWYRVRFLVIWGRILVNIVRILVNGDRFYVNRGRILVNRGRVLVNWYWILVNRGKFLVIWCIVKFLFNYFIWCFIFFNKFELIGNLFEYVLILNRKEKIIFN